LLFFISSPITFSQNAVNDSIKLSEIVVTGSKTEISRKIVPLSLSQISSRDIENSGQINVLQTLNSFVPGIFVTERSLLGFGVGTGGSGSISMRGISSSPNTSVLVLIDGHPQYQGIFGHPLPDAYVASDVEKVEIIRGPASILYGSNAMAGVINMITKKQTAEGLRVPGELLSDLIIRRNFTELWAIKKINGMFSFRLITTKRMEFVQIPTLIFQTDIQKLVMK